jgi:ArsR family transcriptional regulator
LIKSELKLFEALANETRLRILILLAHKELCVCHLEWALKMTQAKISRHLTVLKNAGLVDERRDGLWIFYSLTQPRNGLETDIQKHLKAHFTRNYDSIREDLQNMKKCSEKPLKKLNTIRNLMKMGLKGANACK